MKFRVLSIDAWADCCGDCENDCACSSWTWNNWFILEYYVENLHGVLNEENAELYFKSMFHGTMDDFRNKFYVDDDQYNIVLCSKEDDRPLYAIEYGNS